MLKVPVTTVLIFVNGKYYVVNTFKRGLIKLHLNSWPVI